MSISAAADAEQPAPPLLGLLLNLAIFEGRARVDRIFAGGVRGGGDDGRDVGRELAREDLEARAEVTERGALAGREIGMPEVEVEVVGRRGVVVVVRAVREGRVEDERRAGLRDAQA